MASAKIDEARKEARREDEFEQQELAARHRPDERAPNAPPGPPGSGAGDRHAAGAPAGGSAVGGLAGTNIGDGSPENADIDAAGGGGNFDIELEADEEAYGGFGGGAVGGTPAGKRARGGHTHGGIAPGGVHRGDTTIGGNPE
jgi:hypothetical protein